MVAMVIQEIPQILLTHLQKIGKPLFIWTRWKNENFLHATFENCLLDQINKDNIEYVIITHLRNFLSMYFQKHPGASLLKSFEGGKINIYLISNHPVGPIGFPTKFARGMYNVGVYKYFRKLYEEDNSEYNEQKQNIKTLLRWSEQETERFFTFIESGRKKQFDENYARIIVKENRIY